jgi:uncharacterized protein YjiS (DUF1127 family)
VATFDAFRPALPAAHGSVFSNLLGRIVAWNDRRVTVDALSRLSDHQLDDIGLDRSDVDALANRR